METNEREMLLWQMQHLSATGFEKTALAVFRHQAAHNPTYARYLQLLNRHPEHIHALEDVPFLPISAFKHHIIQTGGWTPALFFQSSGTSGQTPSQHAVCDVHFYIQHTVRSFTRAYGDPADYCTLALLPAYLEREGSSLVLMADAFIQRSKHPKSGFFLHEYADLAEVLQTCVAQRIPTLLLGVSFALLDFAEQHPMPLPGVVVMETGGMKGRRQEMTRSALHAKLQQAFQVSAVHSEYGMTELFSQAYSPGDGLFTPAETMRVYTKEVYDPFEQTAPGRTGVLNVVDLANLDTCSFIATEDLARVHTDGRFEVLGRLDAAEMRGCNLMVEEWRG
jgi:phenylacetate-coenzyme A ligase PaaK-like adenylate-forming protein